jgi:hypothetical protein
MGNGAWQTRDIMNSLKFLAFTFAQTRSTLAKVYDIYR